MTKQIAKGSRQILIVSNDDAGPFSARLYVNVTATDLGDATLVARSFKTLKGAEKWAAKMLDQCAAW